MTFSSTVRAGNGRTIWNVRPIPRRHASSGVSRSIGSPANRIEPASGASAPAIMLNSVVLPAPLGPITAKISPWRTSNSRSWTARSPLKLFDSPATSSSATMSRLIFGHQAQGSQQRRPHAFGPERHHHEKAKPIEDLGGAGHIQAEPGERLAQAFGQPGEQDGTDQRPEQRTDPADDGREDELDRARDVKHLLGKQVVVVKGDKDAGERRHASGDNGRIHLVAEGIDAERARGVFVLADRQPVIADAAVEQRATDEQRGGQHAEDHVIEHGGVAAQVPKIIARIIGDRQEQSARRSDPIEMIETDAGEFGARNGENGEIDPRHPKAEGEICNRRPARYRDGGRGNKADPRTDAEMHVERRRRVGAQSDEQRVAERKLPGQAEHDVPRLSDIGEVEDEDHHGEKVVAGEQREGGEQHSEDDESDAAATRQASNKPPDHVSDLPIKPCGRNSSTSTRMAKTNMLLADGVKSSPASASVSPIRTPPSNAPAIEPSPPVMTTMKASSV